MMKRRAVICGIGLIITILVGFIGCRRLETGSRSPTAPTQITDLMNYWASRVSSSLGVYIGNGGSGFRVPNRISGSVGGNTLWRLTYTTSNAGGIIEFKVLEGQSGAVLCVGYPADTDLVDAYLQEIFFPAGIQYRCMHHPIELYYFPATWYNCPPPPSTPQGTLLNPPPPTPTPTPIYIVKDKKIAPGVKSLSQDSTCPPESTPTPTPTPRPRPRGE